MTTTTIAVDLAKSVFEVAVAHAAGGAPVRHRFTRAQFERFLTMQSPTHVVMEACGTAHFWARTAQAAGHRVTLLPPQHVRPFVRRQKTDRTDTAGLLDAIRSDGLRPVMVKTIGQQELQALHRVRDQWMTTRTARLNALRGFLREHGIVVVGGARRGLAAVGQLLEDAAVPVPGRLRRALSLLVAEVRDLEARIEAVEDELRAVADQRSRHRATDGGSRRRSAHGNGPRRKRRAYPRLSARTSVCELARAHSS